MKMCNEAEARVTDCLQVMDILKRLEQKGYKLVGIKVLVPSRELASKHYAGGLPQHRVHTMRMLAVAAAVASKWRLHMHESLRRPAGTCTGLSTHQQQLDQAAQPNPASCSFASACNIGCRDRAGAHT